MKVRIATRKSTLALWQAEHVAAALRRLDGVDGVELVPLTTRGDRILDRSLQKVGGKGLFIKELEVAMREDRADLAVHSMKDVPAGMPDGFCIAAVLERADPADALVSRGVRFEDLPRGARVGSSSLRRQAQLRMLRPDLVVEPLRGNVDTRLSRVEAGDFDAIVLAAAGLSRLGLEAHITHRFTADEMLPSAAQGVIGIECRTGDESLRALLGQLDHAPTARTTLAEREIAATLQADCHSPVATLAESDGRRMTVTALVALPDGSRWIRDRISGDGTGDDDAHDLGRRLAQRLLDQGAAELLREAGGG